MTDLVTIDHIVKSFGPVMAVDDVVLNIKENEFFALLGASGSGKTTLLRILAGFEVPNGGRILLDGKDIAHVSPAKRPVNLMFQSYALFPHMTVRANIAYGLEMEKLPKVEIDARVNAMLETVQLTALADRKPDQLSGGQKQRVALARALVKKPRLLLLDEPLGALDKKLRSAMQLELKRLQHEVGITFVIVTHDQEEALVMADRIAILKDGKLLQCDTPHAVYERPNSRFVAEFIGVMNFISGEHTERNMVTSNGTKFRGHGVSGEPHMGQAIVAVRPERISLWPRKADNSLTGIVQAMAYHGQDMQIHLRTKFSDKPFLVRVTADAVDQRPIQIGDEIDVGWAAADTKIFTD
jgi:spermidine/putrescine ABC transporter ATP-binding subunit